MFIAPPFLRIIAPGQCAPEYVFVRVSLASYPANESASREVILQHLRDATGQPLAGFDMQE
ncbi:MAG: hypothetical protein OEY04_13780, partial [Gammaproteobacteria bacterium]|nr:hypothetical protein [Gammaproteobacteria bacterium]